MAQDQFKLPELGDGVDSGDVLEVLVREGDVLAKGQDVLELETDKATIRVDSKLAGKITKVHVQTGATVKPGDVILTLEPAGAAEAAPPAKKSPGDAASTAKNEPAKKEPAKKESPKKEPPPAPDAPTPPRVANKPAPAAPTKPLADPPRAAPAATSQPAAANKSPAVGKQAAVKPAPPAADNGRENAEVPPGGAIPAGPAVRRFAREVGVDLGGVQGTGEGGRITRDDVLQAVRAASKSGPKSAAATEEEPQPAAPAAPSPPDEHGPVRIERMSKIRQAIARQMTQSWTTAPRVTNFDDADVTDLEAIREKSKADYASKGVKLTAMPFLIKAVALALRDHPTVNAVVDAANNQIIYKEYVNIGVAVDTERGLVVPVLRGADRLSIPDVARSLSVIAERARNNDFDMKELRGGTFTISNLGAIGGTYATPIINVPEVAILLVGRARKMPVVVNDQVVARLMLPLSLSYDHRLVDGAAAARFLNEVIGYLEAPSRLLLAP